MGNTTGQRGKIPIAAEGELLARAQQGQTSDAIAAWLREAHGVEVDPRTVRRRIRNRAIERADATKGTVRDILGSGVMSDLDVLKKIRDDAMAMAEELRKDDPRAAVQAMRAAADATDKRLHYAGADAEGEELVPGALADLLAAAMVDGGGE